MSDFKEGFKEGYRYGSMNRGKILIASIGIVLLIVALLTYPASAWDTEGTGTGYDSTSYSDRVILVVPNTTAVTSIYKMQWVPDLAVPGTISADFPLSGTVYDIGYNPIGTYTATRDTYDANHTGITVTMDLTGALTSQNLIGGWGITNVWLATLGTGENLTPSYAPSLRFAGYPIRGTTYCNLGELPSANFTASTTSGNIPLSVTFTDASSGFPTTYPYAEYLIDFDDGSYWSGDWQYSGENWFHLYEYAGTYNVTYNITYAGNTYSDYEVITVAEATSNYFVQVAGLNTAPIEGANVSIWYDGIYQDSEGTSPAGRAYFDIPSMRWLNGTVTKSGYQQSNFSQYINTWDTWTSVTLYLDNETQGTANSYGNLIITFRDGITDALIEDVNVKIYSDSGYTNLYTNEWSPSGVYTALVPMNITMYYRASASSYNDLDFNSSISSSPTYMTQYLIPVDYAGMMPNLHVWVYNTQNQPVSGAIVSIDSATDDGYHTTNGTGYTVHYCDDLPDGGSRVYNVTASKGGYTSQSASVTVSTQNPTVTFYLVSTGTTTSPTPTLVYTVPTTPVWSGNNGTPGNYKEMFLNFTMTQFGVGQGEAGILIGLIITLFSAVFVGGCLAGYGAGGNSAGIGAMIGGAFGWIASGMLGFIPIWALVVTVALVAMIFFIFLKGGGGGG